MKDTCLCTKFCLGGAGITSTDKCKLKPKPPMPYIDDHGDECLGTSPVQKSVTWLSQQEQIDKHQNDIIDLIKDRDSLEVNYRTLSTELEVIKKQEKETLVELCDARLQIASLKERYNNLRNCILTHQQNIIARNYNNIGKWHNDVQEYNFKIIEEVTKILTDPKN